MGKILEFVCMYGTVHFVLNVLYIVVGVENDIWSYFVTVTSYTPPRLTDVKNKNKTHEMHCQGNFEVYRNLIYLRCNCGVLGFQKVDEIADVASCVTGNRERDFAGIALEKQRRGRRYVCVSERVWSWWKNQGGGGARDDGKWKEVSGSREPQ